jgi:hypothetical protein
MDEILAEDVRALAASLADDGEAEALVEVFELASDAAFEPQEDEGYTPFVYPH